MEQIYFHNKKLLDTKIQEIKSQGLDKLHVVSDYDRTLTKCFHNGERISAVVGLAGKTGISTKFRGSGLGEAEGLGLADGSGEVEGGI